MDLVNRTYHYLSKSLDMNEFLRKYNLQAEDVQRMGYKRFLEWKWLDDLMEERLKRRDNLGNSTLSYKITRKNMVGFPIEFEIIFKCKSIIGVENKEKPRKPIFGYLHRMTITLPLSYPSVDENPILTFKSNIWHPNIRHSGSFKGHVCLAHKEMGVLTSLRDLVLRVEQYLKYHIYHAEDVYPYPEDKEVAMWVREEAEPNGWTRFGQK